MSLKVDMLEHNMAKLTIEVSAEEFDKAMDKAYNKVKNNINIQGFRKGKAPKSLIEKLYGPSIFYEDAVNEIIPVAYEREVEESDLEVVSQAKDLEVVQVEKGKPCIFTVKVALMPEVTLGEYKGIKVKKQDVEVTDADIEDSINKTREQNARIIPVEDRAAKMGDTTIIDFEGFIDDVAFEGGKGTDYTLVLGSHSFIDTFEDQIAGKNIGDEFDVNVTFPEDYQAENLKGKPAVFKVKLKEIKEKQLPDVDDEFVQDVSGFDTLDEYKEDIKKTLLKSKTELAKSQKEDEVMAKIVENATMDIPEAMHEYETQKIIADYDNRLKMQGLNMEQYLGFMGMDKAGFIETVKPQAMKRIQNRLVLEAIVKAENITASDEEYNEELEKMSKDYKLSKEEIEKSLGAKGMDAIKVDIAVQKAIDFVRDAAIEE
ncbi:MAG: trigger factor [Lachnospiraceae bacterium]|nr:trigger factor [Lachnospiraceae bacterium]